MLQVSFGDRRSESEQRRALRQVREVVKRVGEVHSEALAEEVGYILGELSDILADVSVEWSVESGRSTLHFSICLKEGLESGVVEEAFNIFLSEWEQHIDLLKYVRELEMSPHFGNNFFFLLNALFREDKEIVREVVPSPLTRLFARASFVFKPDEKGRVCSMLKEGRVEFSLDEAPVFLLSIFLSKLLDERGKEVVEKLVKSEFEKLVKRAIFELIEYVEKEKELHPKRARLPARRERDSPPSHNYTLYFVLASSRDLMYNTYTSKNTLVMMGLELYILPYSICSMYV